MSWDSLYNSNCEPSFENITKYISNPLWEDLNSLLQETYKVNPEKSYSSCSGAPGWNVKYKKSGKSLCTLYPMEGYFIALVVIGNKEMIESELLMPMCTEYIQKLYKETLFSCGGKWLMINVTNKEILEDTKNLINIRVKPKK